jgi:hypothetical protein
MNPGSLICALTSILSETHIPMKNRATIPKIRAYGQVYIENRYTKGIAARLPHVPGAFGKRPEPNHVAIIQEILSFNLFMLCIH